MTPARNSDQAMATTVHPSRPGRRSLLPAARRVLWSLLRARACGPRRALRERLRNFLRGAGRGRLLRLVRETTFAAAVVAALLSTATPAPAQAIELADIAAGKGGFAVQGEGRLPSSIGWSVADAGDVNGDGIPDAIVGSLLPSWWGITRPSYVVFGTADGAPIEIEDVATGTGGFEIRGDSEDYSGFSVSGAGDVNGDGLADVLVGAPNNYEIAAPGASYVVFGKRTTEAVELSDVAAGQGGFVIRGEREYDRSGYSVSGAGDLNGDGVPDLAVTTSGWLDGMAYVVFGPLREGVPRFRRGEVNGDLRVNLSDAVATLNYLFAGDDAPGCLDGADANDDGHVNLSDAVATLEYLFGGGSAPSVPGPVACGIDPTADPLGCEQPAEDCQ